jgi:hypothetical protein
MMPHSPSIVPEHTDREIYIVLDDFGLLAKVWRETNDADADRETLIQDLLDGQYEDPIRIVAFNTAQGWSRDVTKDIANELQEICAERGETPGSIEEFIREHARRRPTRQLRFQL